MPWRIKKTGYRVWISEIMLQQTQVKTVIPYYKRWMKRFPSLASLAKAKEQEVLKMWEGLGYYSRAKNILKTAVLLTAEKKNIPREKEQLLLLPGIGPYTAAAIASLAFGEVEPVIDGNVERVISRLYDYHAEIKTSTAQAWLHQTLMKNIPPKNPSDFNEGLMELGATQCLPGQPDCTTCPLQSSCQAYGENTVAQLPKGIKRTKIIPKYLNIYLLKKKERSP